MRATRHLAFPITYRSGTKPVEERQDAISFDWERWCGQLSTRFGRGCRFRSETRDHAQIRLRGPALRTRFRRTPTLFLFHTSVQSIVRANLPVGRVPSLGARAPQEHRACVAASRRSTLPPSVLDASGHAEAPEPGSSRPCKVAR